MAIIVYSRVCLLVASVLTWVCAYAHAVPHPAIHQSLVAAISEQLKTRIAAGGYLPDMTVYHEAIHTRRPLVRFYESRGFHPFWLRHEGWLPQADVLIQVIRQAEREGLSSAAYHLSSIERLRADLERLAPQDRAAPLHTWVDLELLLTNAFFTYGSHVLAGQIDPRDLKEAWFGQRPQLDLATALQEASETGRAAALLHNLRPLHPGYTALQTSLASYRHIATQGGWPAIPVGPKLQKGDRGPRVTALRHRLQLTSDLAPAATATDDLFDATLEHALQKFQERHGLNPDGVMGPATLTALNVPIEARVRQIELNMERWRWLPQAMPERHILVNIANFTLDVVEHGRSVLAMRVVVGKPARRTPFFSAEMTHLVFSPHWHVPPTIAIQDKLPLIRRDPGYVAQHHFKLFRHGAGGESRVDPSSVDWSSVSARNFPYQLRQDPGPRNALGRVKFMMPNPYHVYLHDTPARELFDKYERAFSSGCIRLEKPLELAAYLLRDDPQWSQQKILASSVKRTEQVVHLPASIPVHLLYFTAWANDHGIMQFRKDIYERDKVLDKALEKRLFELSREDKVELVVKHQ